ncbi:MAG: YaaL family protein [Desulfotomaculaceae bacterium]|nr:YaaL family protein [Desulfotomaculaceae bacterium]
MNIITVILSWLNTLNIAPPKLKARLAASPGSHTLMSAIDNARRDWQQALREFDQVDNDCTDYVIYKINSTERYYMFLLKQARQEGLKVWPTTIVNVAAAPSNTHP